jgi:hypothetical protein
MDINYLLRREQQSLARAKSSPSPAARAAHQAFAEAYGRLLVKSSYPHNRFQTDDERAVLREDRERRSIELASSQDDEGPAAPSELAT